MRMADTNGPYALTGLPPVRHDEERLRRGNPGAAGPELLPVHAWIAAPKPARNDGA